MASIRTHVTRDLAALESTTPVRDAARLMAEKNIGSVAVRERGRIVGLVTERDLVTTVVARGADPALAIREAMRPGIPRVGIDAGEAEVATRMRELGTRHLLVEENGEVVGIVSMRDIIQLMLDEKQFVIEQLSAYIGQG
jgi:CBS domain-containing protein